MELKWSISARNLWFSYDGRTWVLRGVSLEVKPGEVVVVMGPTGCGKTTLLLLLAGLLKPSKGEVYYNSKPLQSLLPSIKRYIGFLFQDPDDQLFNPSVYDEIAFSLRTLGLGEDKIRERVHSIARTLGLTSVLKRQPYRLSVGEKKKVALASILVYDPSILFLDEPTANLDYSTTVFIEKLIVEAKSKGKTVIIASHDLDFTLRIADKIYVLVNGSIASEHKPVELFSKSKLVGYGLKPTSIVEVVEELRLDKSMVLEIIRRLKQ